MSHKLRYFSFYRAPFYDAVAHFIKPDRFCSRVRGLVDQIFQGMVYENSSDLSNLMIQSIDQEAASFSIFKFLTALSEIALDQRIGALRGWVYRNHKVTPEMKVQSIKKLLRECVKEQSKSKGHTDRPPGSTKTDRTPGPTEGKTEARLRELKEVFNVQEIKDKKDLYSKWRMWSLRNHPDHAPPERKEEVHQLFVKVTSLKDECADLFDAHHI
jgi:hypothetical protein